MDLDKLKANGIKPYYEENLVKIFHGDCREILLSLSGFSAIVTDPPYHLVNISKRFGSKTAHNTPAMDMPEGAVWARMAKGFMGQEWDGTGISFQKETWDIIRKSCLPGAPLMAFGGARTQHRIACAIEDAGWEIRDALMWVYGQGFPKSLDISKAREVGYNETVSNTPVSPEAKLWEGYGTSLKPAYEPIILAMNPLDGTFAENALKYGVAGLNIDGCRIETEERIKQNKDKIVNTPYEHNKGRFPANFLHNGSQEVMELFPETSKGQSAARFFYCAKASRTERNMGCENMETLEENLQGLDTRGRTLIRPDGSETLVARWKATPCPNNHPTVKPLALMEYLCKLVKMPEYNLILDPFMGSGTTLLACIKLGIPCVGIEQDEHYCEIAAKRCHKLISDIYSE